MLYLAEVQKKGAGFIGGGKAELRLLACQRSEQNWTAVSGDEVIPSDEANNYASGALVLVDIAGNRQPQRIQEAGRPLVSILQNFSRMQEKFKTQEEEIEQWKQSLTYQSQELNRREMEMEARREQLQQLEEDVEQFEQHRQELETLQEEINRQKESYERNRQELEGAWEHFRGEMRRFEEQKASVQQNAVLDEEKARFLQNLLDRLSVSIVSPGSTHEQVNASFEVLGQHQDRLSHHWQVLEQQRSQAQQQQQELEQRSQDLHHRWQEWHKAQETLEQARSELKAQQATLNTKQEYARILSVQLQNHEELHQQLFRLVETSDNISVGLQIDVEALEQMPLDELQRMVHELENELEKMSRFVESQEEELRYKQQEIDELRAKIEAASDFDRLNLENELVDEQDGYQMLNETLVGQRRNLQARNSILKQHQSILRKRQGMPEPEGADGVIDLGPVISQIDAQKQQQSEELHKLEAQIEQMKGVIHQAEDMITHQSVEQENKRNELKQLELDINSHRSVVAQMQGRVNLYQELLQPVQDTADSLRQKLEAIVGDLAQVQEISSQQSEAISEMKQLLISLTNPQELALS